MLQVPTEERLGNDAAVAQAAGEHTEDERAEAQVWAPEESIDATAAAAAAEAATKKRKAKKPWICAACAKHHYERSAVRPAGGSYVCRELCGVVEGRRERRPKRPLEAGM